MSLKESQQVYNASLAQRVFGVVPGGAAPVVLGAEGLEAVAEAWRAFLQDEGLSGAQRDLLAQTWGTWRDALEGALSQRVFAQDRVILAQGVAQLETWLAALDAWDGWR